MVAVQNKWVKLDSVNCEASIVCARQIDSMT